MIHIPAPSSKSSFSGTVVIRTHATDVTRLEADAKAAWPQARLVIISEAHTSREESIDLLPENHGLAV